MYRNGGLRKIDGARPWRLASLIIAVLCASCAAQSSSVVLPVGGPQNAQKGTSAPDGFEPSSRLVALNGVLYGTTSTGGANNQGTVYRITTTGAENVLYSFAVGCYRRKECADGLNPTGLAALNDTLYGTTGGGGRGPCKNEYGPNGCGTLFSVTTGGAEAVLYSFTGGGCGHPRHCRDANYPNGLNAISGTLYGTSWYGGPFGLGTVWGATIRGAEKVLHSFGHGGEGFNAEGGAYPNGGLISINGTLYGTTLYGGTEGAGVMFRMSKTGRTNVLYSFDASDGGGSAGASGNLVDVNGKLYGTTGAGGTYGKGTVFSSTTSGTLSVVHNFGGGADGQDPSGGLIDVKGVLYGVTFGGGSSASGTVFSVTTSGNEKVLHNFGLSNYDGSNPTLSLTELKGVLYGTTLHGGRCGGGTVFSITLKHKVTVLHSFC